MEFPAALDTMQVYMPVSPVSTFEKFKVPSFSTVIRGWLDAWVRTVPFGRSHRTADMAAVRHRSFCHTFSRIFRSLGASAIKGAEHCIAPVSPRSSSTNWRPLMCAGEWQRPQHVEFVGMYSRSQRASQSESQPQFQGLWWRWSSTRNLSGVKRSWGSELRLLWAKFSSTKEARSSNAFRSISLLRVHDP